MSLEEQIQPKMKDLCFYRGFFGREYRWVSLGLGSTPNFGEFQFSGRDGSLFRPVIIICAPITVLLTCSHGVPCCGFGTSHLYNSSKFKSFPSPVSREVCFDYVKHRWCLYKICNGNQEVLNFQVCAAVLDFWIMEKIPLTLMIWINM